MNKNDLSKNNFRPKTNTETIFHRNIVTKAKPKGRISLGKFAKTNKVFLNKLIGTKITEDVKGSLAN